MKSLFLASLVLAGLSAIPAADHSRNDSRGDRQAAPHAEASSQAKADYPLDVCAVSGEELGGMGEPYDHTHREAGKPDRLVRMCCEGCVKRFNQNPGRYLARIDAAAKQRREEAVGAGKRD